MTHASGLAEQSMDISFCVWSSDPRTYVKPKCSHMHTSNLSTMGEKKQKDLWGFGDTKS